MNFELIYSKWKGFLFEMQGKVILVNPVIEITILLLLYIYAYYILYILWCCRWFYIFTFIDLIKIILNKNFIDDIKKYIFK